MKKFKQWKIIWLVILYIVFGGQYPAMAEGVKIVATLPDYSKYPPVGPYPTKAALFEAMASGKMLLSGCFADCPDFEWWSIVTVLQSDYGSPDVTQFIGPENVKPGRAYMWKKNVCLKESTKILPDLVSRINFIVAEEEGSNRAKEAGVSYKGAFAEFDKKCNTSEFGKKFFAASVDFLNDYVRFYDQYVGVKKIQDAKNKEDLERREQMAKQLSQQYAICQKTPAYIVFDSSKRVLDGQQQVKLGQDMLDRERRLEATSGVSNLARKREAGEVIVAAQDYVTQWFGAYKKAGGKAVSPSQVAVPANPCPVPDYAAIRAK